MRYPIAIEISNDGTAFDVVIPDMPGCVGAGGTLNDAIRNAEEAALTWLVVTLAGGRDVPAPSTFLAVQRDPRYAGWVLSWIDIDTSPTAATP